jgi:hypothetical protein
MTEAQPLYTTLRHPDRKNLGTAAVRLASLLNLTLLPWQLQAIELMTEYEDKRFCYTDGTLLLPRRSGKSVWALIMFLVRCYSRSNSFTWYAAQDLKSARELLVTSWLPILDNSQLHGDYKVRLASGSERITFSNGSSIGLITSTSKVSGHGIDSDLFVQDEGFSLIDSRTELAMKPASATRTEIGGGSQMLLISTAGTPAGSPYLLSKVERGRQLVASGIQTGSCYVEYAAPPDADISDPRVWAACNPALGYTITEDAIRSEYETLEEVDFRRSRLNIWTETLHDPVVDLVTWEGLIDRDSERGPALAISFDSSPDGKWSSIAAASIREDGLYHVGLLDYGKGTGWITSAVKKLYTEHHPNVVVCDPNSPAALAIPALGELGVQVTSIPTVDRAKSFAAFTAAVDEGMLRHMGDPELTDALMGASLKPSGDSFTWSRRGSSVDISPIVAVSEALHAVQTVNTTIFAMRLDETDAYKNAGATEEIVWNPETKAWDKFEGHREDEYDRLFRSQPPEKWLMLCERRGVPHEDALKIVAERSDPNWQVLSSSGFQMHREK